MGKEVVLQLNHYEDEHTSYLKLINKLIIEGWEYAYNRCETEIIGDKSIFHNVYLIRKRE